eukprot:TRINITY_DN57043_c0_g1_i1.p1 TRINITY_DN57043_c0_g1~~TRINITY_DN57043_c0_g1_i1.p1  ORF type:complete len:339 (-),score=44.37 TRINITY_DN57043_c0_g1_i1:279-1196(-)
MRAADKAVFRAQFHAWDTDGSGRIDRGEFGKVMETCGLSSRIVDRVFKCIDIDCNGLIEREEFINWLDPTNHATKTDSSEVARRVRNCVQLASMPGVNSSSLKPPIQNLRTRFPDAQDSELKRALVKTSGHGGRAIQLLEEEASRAQLMQFQTGLSRPRCASQTPPERRREMAECGRRPSLPSLFVSERKESEVVPIRATKRRPSETSSSSGSVLETDEDEELAACERFLFGDVVVLQNFPSTLNLNRSRGIIRGWCEQARRYEVQIPGSHGYIRVAANNLRISKKKKRQDTKDNQGEGEEMTKK